MLWTERGPRPHADLRRAGARRRRVRRVPARGGRRGWRPRRRLRAEHSGGGGRDARRRVASARCGRRARPTSARPACSIASARSSRRCSSTADGYRYGGKAHRLAAARAGVPRVAAERRAGRRRAASRDGAPSPGRPDVQHGAWWRDALAARRRCARRPSSRDCRSIIRCTSCTRRGPRDCPSAWCTARAARCCSISRSSCCTPTSRAATASSTSPPAGWMMWNWLVSASRSARPSCSTTARRCCAADPILWDVVATRAAHRLRHEREVDRARREGRQPAARARTTSPRCARSSPPGSPLAASGFDYVYERGEATTSA